MDTLYSEKTIIGHFAGRLRSDPIILSRQQLTRDWRKNRAAQYHIYISQLVVDECSTGDGSAAQKRLAFVTNLEMLDGTTATDSLANATLRKHIEGVCRDSGF